LATVKLSKLYPVSNILLLQHETILSQTSQCFFWDIRKKNLKNVQFYSLTFASFWGSMVGSGKRYKVDQCELNKKYTLTINQLG